MSRCIHVYPFVARNHGGIPFSGVCPKKYVVTVLPGCNFWKACIRRGGSLRNEKKWYFAVTLGQQQQLWTLSY